MKWYNVNTNGSVKDVILAVIIPWCGIGFLIGWLLV